MSLVSNTIHSISGSFKSVSPNGNLQENDNTFADLLEKQMLYGTQNNLFNQINETAEVAGIEGFDIQDLITSTKNNKSADIYTKPDDEIGPSEMVAFLSKPFDSHSMSDQNHGLMKFAKKQAANFYTKCASNVVVDLKEFVEDALSLS